MKFLTLAFLVSLMFLPAFVVGNGPTVDIDRLKKEWDVAEARRNQASQFVENLNIGERVSKTIGDTHQSLVGFVASFQTCPEETAQVDASE